MKRILLILGIVMLITIHGYAQTTVPELDALGAAPASTDEMLIIDKSATPPAAGTDKRIVISNLLLDINTALGLTYGSVNFGTFTGSTIADNQTAKQALQALETAVETKITASGDAGTPSAIVLTNGTGLPLTTGVTGTLPHENGGLEADISAYDGLIWITGGVTSNATSGADLATALGLGAFAPTLLGYANAAAVLAGIGAEGDLSNSAGLAGALDDETGAATGTPLAVFNQNPTIDSPALTTTLTLDNGFIVKPALGTNGHNIIFQAYGSGGLANILTITNDTGDAYPNGALIGDWSFPNFNTIEFNETDAISDCTGFSATGGGIFYDDSEGKFKKCQDNVLSDLDTTGSGSLGSNLTSTTNDIVTDNTIIQFEGNSENLTLTFGSNAITASTDSGVTDISFSAINISTTGVIKGRASYGADITGAIAHNTTATHGVFYHFTAAATVTLDAAADAGYGAQVCYRVRDAAEAAVIDLDASEKINLAGTALAAGTAITATGAGESVCMVATTDTDGSGTDGWEAWGPTSGWASE